MCLKTLASGSGTQQANTYVNALSGVSAVCMPGSNIRRDGIQNMFKVECSYFKCLLMSKVHIILIKPTRRINLALRLPFEISSYGFALGAYTYGEIFCIGLAVSAKEEIVKFPWRPNSSLFLAGSGVLGFFSRAKKSFRTLSL